MKTSSGAAAYIFPIQRQSQNKTRDGKKQLQAHLALTETQASFIGIAPYFYWEALRKNTQDRLQTSSCLNTWSPSLCRRSVTLKWHVAQQYLSPLVPQLIKTSFKLVRRRGQVEMTVILLKYDHGIEKCIAFPIEMFKNALFAGPEGDNTF